MTHRPYRLARRLRPALLKGRPPSASADAIAATSPAVWLRGDDLAGADGATLTTWPGHGGTPSATAAGAVTLAVAGGIGGHKAASLPGGAGAGFTVPLTLSSALATFLIVLRRDAAATGAGHFSAVDGTGLDYSAGTFFTQYEQTTASIVDYRAGNRAFLTHPGSALPFLALAEFDGVNNTLTIPAGTGVTGSTLAVAEARSFATTTLAVGSRYYGGGLLDAFHGAIAEFIAWARILTAPERAAVLAAEAALYSL